MNKKRNLKKVITGGLLSLVLTSYIPTTIKTENVVLTINSTTVVGIFKIDPPVRPPE
jgi:hypothetical protein